MVLVMYGWQLESILSRFAARFGHTNHSLAIWAMREPPLPRLMYDFGLIFVEHVRRKHIGVCVCVSGCANVCVARSRFAVIDTTAPRTALTSAQGSLSCLRKMQKRQKQNETQRNKNQIEFSLDREWATPDVLLKTINRFDIERAAGRLKDTKIHRIALHCIAEQS